MLLIGDSIARGYTIPVRELLYSEAEVSFVPSHPVSTTIETSIENFSYIDKNLGNEKYDVCHFNWGFPALWLKGDGKNRVPLTTYEDKLKELVERLKRACAKLIWASTTPVPAGITNPNPEDVPKFNAVATKMMNKSGIFIDDLYTFAMPLLPEIQIKDNLHFTPNGYDTLSGQVASTIREILAW